MTAVLDDTLFEDPTRLLDVDRRELLRTAALAGAQVRSAAERAASAGVPDFGGERPRAVVLLARPGLGMRVCEVLAALAGRASVPIVVAEALPAWVGALDAVFVHAADQGDADLAEAVDTASRRGARVVVVAEEEGPVAASGAGRALLVPPTFPVPEELSFAHVFAVGLVVFAELGLLTVDVEALAAELDSMAEQSHPAKESVVNPAKTLALRLADRTPVLWGVDPVSTAVARHGAFVLGCHVGVPCAVADYSEAVAQRTLHRMAGEAGSATALFADPEEDEEYPLRVFLVSARPDERGVHAELGATRDLPGADLVTPDESVAADPVLRAAVLAVQLDFTAVYLGLAAGTLDGPSWSTVAAS
ncbi:hypothetical protein GCM10027174_38020 [Salinifilum aidingensis]